MNLSRKVSRVLDLAEHVLSRAESVLLSVLIVVALVLGVMQVVLRYVFNTGFHWNEAIFILVTISAMLIAGARAIRDNKHVKVDILLTTLGGPAERMLRVLANVASFALCAYFAWAGWANVAFLKVIDTAAPDTGLKDWLVYSIMPSVMILFSIRYLLLIISSLVPSNGPADGAATNCGDQA